MFNLRILTPQTYLSMLCGKVKLSQKKESTILRQNKSVNPTGNRYDLKFILTEKKVKQPAFSSSGRRFKKT